MTDRPVAQSTEQQLKAALQDFKAEIVGQVATETSKSEGSLDVAKITAGATIASAIITGVLLMGQRRSTEPSLVIRSRLK